MAFNLNKLCPTAVRRTCLPSEQMLIPNRLVGIEVEVENWPYNVDRINSNPPANHIAEFWTGKTDGSLRNNGIEFVTQPILGDDIINALSVFEEGMSMVSSKIKFSVRTSDHVHVDVRNLTSEELRSSTLMYSILERLIFNEMFPTRKDSVFCVPLYSENSIKNKVVSIFDAIEKGEQNKVFEVLRRTPRYMGLNLAAIIKYSTIEFRHCIGTARKDILLNWINTIFGIINAKEIPYNVLVDSLKDRDKVNELIAQAFKWHYGYLSALPNYNAHIDAGIADSLYLTGGGEGTTKDRVEIDESQYYKVRKEKFLEAKKQKSKRPSISMGEIVDNGAARANDLTLDRVLELHDRGMLFINDDVADVVGAPRRGAGENFSDFIHRILRHINDIREDIEQAEEQTIDEIDRIEQVDAIAQEPAEVPAPAEQGTIHILAGARPEVRVRAARNMGAEEMLAEWFTRNAEPRREAQQLQQPAEQLEPPDWWTPPILDNGPGTREVLDILGIIQQPNERAVPFGTRAIRMYREASIATKNAVYRAIIEASQAADRRQEQW